MIDSRRQGSSVLLVALVFVFGVEMMRFHFGSLGWYQRDTLGIGALDLIPIALLPFLAGALLPLASRLLTIQVSLWAGVVVLVAARLANQLLADPELDHITSGVAVAAFVGLLALLVSLGRPAMVGGVLLGITLDSGIKALGSTLDLAYRPGPLAVAATAVMAAAAVYALATLPPAERSGPTWGEAVTLVGLGPFLFVQYLVLQSPGWTAELTGTSTGIAGVRIVVLNVIGIWLAARLGGSRLAVAISAAVVAAAVLWAEGPALAFNVLALVAVPAAAVLWAGMVPDVRRSSLAPAATSVVVASVVFLAVGFAYYLPLDLELGFTQGQARAAAAILLAVFGLGAAARRRFPRQPSVSTGVAVLAAGAIALPLVGLLGSGTLPDPPGDQPVRYMSYNLHQAFATDGSMDVDAIARVIIDSDATVVGLQEVARAGLLNSNTDLFHLLGERLGWEHSAFMGTTDPVWGNAILSRYPIGEVERRYLPTVGTPYRRGYLAAPVATPAGDVLFISTHLQHVNDADAHAQDPEADLYPVHAAQLEVVIEEWAGRQPAVLVGDLNARPGWRQVEELLAAGWVDAWDEAGSGPGYTSNAADPLHRIDYVFHTPDMETVSAEVIESGASDHFPVVAEIAVAG